MKQDDVARGLWVTILQYNLRRGRDLPGGAPWQDGVVEEGAFHFWREEDAAFAEYLQGTPLLILAVALPYIVVISPDGTRSPWDLREAEIMPLERSYVDSLIEADVVAAMESEL